jgi:hypothetical protein
VLPAEEDVLFWEAGLMVFLVTLSAQMFKGGWWGSTESIQWLMSWESIRVKLARNRPLEWTSYVWMSLDVFAHCYSHHGAVSTILHGRQNSSELKFPIGDIVTSGWCDDVTYWKFKFITNLYWWFEPQT